MKFTFYLVHTCLLTSHYLLLIIIIISVTGLASLTFKKKELFQRLVTDALDSEGAFTPANEPAEGLKTALAFIDNAAKDIMVTTIIIIIVVIVIDVIDVIDVMNIIILTVDTILLLVLCSCLLCYCVHCITLS